MFRLVARVSAPAGGASGLGQRGEEVDPVTIVVTALAAGTGAGLKDSASAAVMDAYGGLKSLARKRLAGRGSEMVVDRHAEVPEAWKDALASELSAAGAQDDGKLVAAALNLLSLVDKEGFQAGKYQVQIRNSQGVQAGDGNVQINKW